MDEEQELQDGDEIIGKNKEINTRAK
jgi:hypothetical protein